MPLKVPAHLLLLLYSEEEWVPGTHNSAADVLSHLLNHNNESDDNVEVTVLKETYFETRAMHDNNSLEACIWAAQCQKTDPVIAKNLLGQPLNYLLKA